MRTQEETPVLHLCIDVDTKHRQLMCCGANVCRDGRQSPILHNGQLTGIPPQASDSIDIPDRLAKIDELLKVLSGILLAHQWNDRLTTETDRLGHDLLTYRDIADHYRRIANSRDRSDIQLIVEQHLHQPYQYPRHRILNNPLEFWSVDGNIAPLMHPVIKRIRFSPSVSSPREPLRLEGQPLLCLFIEGEGLGSLSPSARDIAHLMGRILITKWKQLYYDPDNLGIISLGWPWATEENILKLVKGDLQPYFSALNEEIAGQRHEVETRDERNKAKVRKRLEDWVNWLKVLRGLKKPRDSDESVETNLTDLLDLGQRLVEEEKDHIRRVLSKNPQGIIHWMGPIRRSRKKPSKLLTLPVYSTSEDTPEELDVWKLVNSIMQNANRSIRWRLFVAASYAETKVNLPLGVPSVDSSNLGQLVEDLLVQTQVTRVLSFLRPIPRQAAQYLFTSLYGALYDSDRNGDLPLALLQARKDLHGLFANDDSGYWAWAAPVLFQLPERPRPVSIGRQEEEEGETLERERRGEGRPVTAEKESLSVIVR